MVQATETVKLLLGKGEPLIGRLLTYDALGMRFREVRLRRDPQCPLCGEMMRKVARTIVDRVPGSAKERTSTYHEWVCPECDYFEEIEDEDAAS